MVYNPRQDSSSLSTGSILVATPSLKDPNFEKSVILLSEHDEQDGSLGVVINKPLKKTLGECLEDFRSGPLSEVEVYVGGPVQQNQLLLAGWKWANDGDGFSLFFGISKEKAIDLLEQDSNMVIKGYLGYAGWGEGQLEGEILENAWYRSEVDYHFLRMDVPPVTLWRRFVQRFDSTFDGSLDYPEDPSLN